jgi:hypothetical protein
MLSAELPLRLRLELRKESDAMLTTPATRLELVLLCASTPAFAFAQPAPTAEPSDLQLAGAPHFAGGGASLAPGVIDDSRGAALGAASAPLDAVRPALRAAVLPFGEFAL